jgi:hypothetical protein
MRVPRVLLPALVVCASGATAVLGLALGSGWFAPATLAGPIGDGSANRRERAAFTTRGFYRPEIDTSRSRQFSWTGAQALIRFPHIDRHRPYRVRLTIAAGRGPTTGPPPHVVVSIDGIRRLAAETSNETRTFEAIAPASSASSLAVGLDVSNTFVPGPSDPRPLGVIVDEIAIEPVNASWRPTNRVFLQFGLVAMVTAAVFLASGLAIRWTLALSGAVLAAQLWLLTKDGAFLGAYIERLVNIAAGAGVAGALIVAARHVWPAAVHPPGWTVAAAVTVVAAALKLAFFGHPNVALADSIFQVHRAQNVAAGEYFFTSITPRPFFEFPYAIALYVTAMPLWDWFPSELDRVRLLRGLSIAADAVVGLAMYFALRRARPERGTALAFAALWPFARSPLGALCTSNLTNLFGQALFGTAMALVVWMAAAGVTRAAPLAGLLALLTVAFLSHFSTISVGIPLAGGIGVLLMMTSSAVDARRLGAWVLGLTLVAGGLSYAVYYSHFHPVYRATIDRILANDGADEERSMAAPVGVKAGRSARMMVNEFGWAALAAAAGGAVWLARQGWHPASIAIAGWAIGWLTFAALGIATPIEMRANLAAAPLVLALASCAVGRLAQSSRIGAAVAVALGVAIAWDGFTRWTHCLTG